MYLKPFEYLLPLTWQEALTRKSELGAEAEVLAGGTDVMVKLQGGKKAPSFLLSLRKLEPVLRYIKEDGNGIEIGPMTTHDDLDRSSLLRSGYTALAEGASLVGSPQIRHAATIGGNICSALPSADTCAPLIAFGGELTLSSLKGDRRIDAEDFFVGPGKSILSEDELLKSIHLAPAERRSGSAYLKFGRRKAMEIALAGATCFVAWEQEQRVFRRVRIVLTSSAPTPWRCKEAEEILLGKRPTKDLLQAAAKQASAEAKPRSSFRSTEEYRRFLIVTLVLRALEKAIERADMND